jgi:hypothetical protein
MMLEAVALEVRSYLSSSRMVVQRKWYLIISEGHLQVLVLATQRKMPIQL